MKTQNNRCLIDPIWPAAKSASGLLYLPENRDGNDLPNTGVVVEAPEKNRVGDHCTVPCPVKPGDTVCFDRTRALPIIIDEKKMLFVNINDIFATL